MKFGNYPLAAGAILAHGLRTGARAWRKGQLLSEADVAALKAEGITHAVLALPQAGDVREDEAASRIAKAVTGEASHISIGAAFTGRANLYALEAGLLLVDAPRIHALNARDEAITLACLPPFARVAPRQMLATIKIIPFAAPADSVAALEAQAAGAIRVAPFRRQNAALISTRLPGTRPSLLEKNRVALESRLASLGSQLVSESRVAHDSTALAAALREAAAAGADPILVFGASAISDRRDVIPAALELAGGHVTVFGMPVDPGNLLLAGTLDGKTVLGLPGCARSPKLNGFDFVLWRVLAGLPVGRAEIAAMGVGGLLTDIPSRPHPRESGQEVLELAAPRIGAIVLAAGASIRMGADNKLLQPVGGKPMIRHAVEAALESAATPVIVVTGSEAAEIRAALEGLPVTFRDNPDFSKGLSTSLISGLNGLPDNCDGALVLLGDMPGVDAALLDRLIAAFDLAENRAIIVPIHGGTRGNPILWGSRFFPEMRGLAGDAGARRLLADHPTLICEIEAASDGPLTDIDTPDALAGWRSRLADKAADRP